MANYTTGTITLTNGSAVVIGTGTAWQTALIVAGVVYPDAAGNPLPIASVNSNVNITAATKWRGATGTYAYAIAREDDENQIIRNAEALSELIEEMRNGTLFKYDVSGPLSGRNSYGAQPQGFSYLVNDGATLALYVKRSATLNDWAGPFSYGVGPQGIQGPTGPYTEIIIGTVTTRPAGSGATVTQTVVDADTVALNFGIPAGQNGTGTGSVTSVGLSAPTGLTVGGSPVTTSGTLALTWSAGYQGYTTTEANKLAGIKAGSDVTGPASAANLHLAVFSGTTGKVITSIGFAPGNAAARNVGTVAGTVAAGDDGRMNDNVKTNVESQTITGGAGVTALNLGVISAGTVTIDPSRRPMQSYNNGGAHTFAPAAVTGYCVVQIYNSATAGAITFTGFAKVSGDAYVTDNTALFLAYVTNVTGVPSVALQRIA
ncbi:hypothetical protein J2T09_002365 [Neorhizobium huautlense]|uniref:Tail fiber protein n=1 Tax=Neorhizobium huautlense TaxID=67774 RepID=A0ABT9PT22_9HYPH|nr:hypothetical protein [Neorhizobium huautlense]MDP9837613.1 hypothetical protein [Neorhizobium huautlense]